MSIRTIIVAGIAAAGLLIAGGARADTAITTQWKEISISQERCLDRAEEAIRGGGFKTLPHTQESRHGYRGDYTVAIRCMAEKEAVFFVVAGPSRDRTPRYMEDIYSHFR